MDAFLLLNKPIGLSSAACVAKVKKALNLDKIGHTGTLDPFAEGLLPLAIGKATKVIEYLPKNKKRYRAMLKLGEETATLDPEGEVIDRQPVPDALTAEEIKRVFSTFIGAQSQTPPLYSAIKVKGKPLYRYARQGKTETLPEIAPRLVTVDELTLIEWMPPTLVFEVACSGGTYVRSLGRDIARALGTCGHLTTLVRLESDGFYLRDAIALEELLKSPECTKGIVSLQVALRDLPQVVLTDMQQVMALQQGKKWVLAREISPQLIQSPTLKGCAIWQGIPIAIMRMDVESAYLKIEKVL